MSIVVTTPTGHIGSRLAERLLDARTPVTLLARHPEKVAHLAKRGAKVAQGSLNDARFVLEATRGAEVLFWLTPPNPGAADFRAYQNGLGKIAAAAIRENHIPRVVHLSSLGAHHAQGVGPVNGLHDIEKRIDDAAESVTHLRPCMFMENFLASVPTIREAGSLLLPVSGKTRIPLIATRDIAEVAAEVVLDRGWTGYRVLTMQGPDDLTFDGVAKTLSRVLGRTVSHVQVPGERAREALIGMGIGADVAGLYVELYAAFESGFIVAGFPRTPSLRTGTTFEEFAREVIRPAVIA